MYRPTASALPLVALLALGVAAGLWLAASNPGRQVAQVEWLAQPRPVAAFSLASATGRFDRTTLAQGWHLVQFGFSSCPDICPTALTELARLLRSLQGAPLQGVFISLDPARDSPAALSRYAAHFHPAVIAATGEEGELAALATSLGLRYRRGPGNQISHSAVTAVVGPDAQLRGLLRPGFDPVAAAAELRIASAAAP